MREIAEIELAIQGGTEKIETLGEDLNFPNSATINASNPGEQGKVDESMREMAAIEALKTEKADKEVRAFLSANMRNLLTISVARTPAIDGHVRRFGSPEATCV